jgi:hypothetical protein
MKNSSCLIGLLRQSLSSLCLIAALAALTCSTFVGTGLAQGLPTWNGAFIDTQIPPPNVYQFIMVGTDPSQTNGTTNISVYLIPVAVTFTATDGSGVCGQGPVTFDAGTTTLWDGETLVNNVLASPIFTGINFPEGNGIQYIDAFQRGNFWEYVSQSQHSNYHLHLGSPNVNVLQELALPTLVPPAYGKAVNGSNTGGYAGCIGSAYQQWIVPQLTSLLSYPEVLQLPQGSLVIFLTYDVFIGAGNTFGPIGAGVHGSSPGGTGPQTWAWASYNGGLQDENDRGYCGFDSNNKPITCYFQDVDDLSHELAEWADDPFGATPDPCGGGFLEVGDPLLFYNTSAYFKYTGANNGYTYHLQDLVFLPYFGAANATAYEDQLTFQGNPEGISYCLHGG